MKPETPFRTYNHYLRDRYGERVNRVSLNAGFTCPNRDGTRAVGGCIYCNNESFNFSPKSSLADQLAAGIEKARKRYGARKFIAYFQAYTNTYGSPEILYDAYSTIFGFPEIIGLSIGTRPDCVPEEVLRVIEPFAKTHEVWIEYGLESSNDETLRKINRAHTFAEFRDAVLRTAGRGIRIATHIIIGFPWEDEATVMQTGQDIARLPVDAVKIHNLHIVRGTALERMYLRAPFHLLSLEEYALLAAKVLEVLPPETILMRLTAECPPDLLVAPDWCNRKQEITKAIIENLKMRNSYQGKAFKKYAEIT